MNFARCAGKLKVNTNNFMTRESSNLSPFLYSESLEQRPTRDGYGQGLLELGARDPRVVVLTADLAESTRVLPFATAHPERFIDVGVAEQNMMGIAAGLALAGKIPFVSSYAVFSPGRNWDQLRVSVCYNNANVKIAGAHAGLSVGPDGATHQALEDIAITRVLPNLTVIVPCDAEETRKATLAIARHTGPVYFRFSREKSPLLTTKKTPFIIGKATILRNGNDVSLIACGPLVYEALLAARALERSGVRARVINMHTIKPLDTAALRSAARQTGAIVTIEEHQITGGLGGAVAEWCSQSIPTPIEMIAVRDSFGESGTPEQLLTKYGLRARDIVRAAKKVLRRKK